MAPLPIRSLRPHRTVLDRGTDKYRSAQITSIVGGTTTSKVQVEANIARVMTCSTSLIPVDAQSIGCPICVRVTGSDAGSYVIAEVIGSSYADPPRGDPAASVARGEFRPGIVPRSLTNEPELWWEG